MTGRRHDPGDSRLDALAKASGTQRYTADVDLPGLVHAAIVRATVPSARIAGIDTVAAEAVPGVLGVFAAADLGRGRYGRAVRDVPVLADGEVRFVGERVAAVVATTRAVAEEAAGLVEVRYESRPAVFDPAVALEEPLRRVHEEAWSYPGAVVTAADPPNLQSRVEHGSKDEVEAALAECDHVVRATFATPAGHQGYLEPQACVARVSASGQAEVWATNKSPHALARQVADCLGLAPGSVAVRPIALGGDFGGKGSPMDVPLCVELARAVARPVKLVIRYEEDLMATNPRHPARISVALGSDASGRFRALDVDAVLDGGAYAGFKPLPTVTLHGLEEVASCYAIGSVHVEARIAYTNSVPKGHMRAPGSPQAIFALESAVSELARRVGLADDEIRRRNLRSSGTEAERRSGAVLDAALGAFSLVPAPVGWRHGRGLALYERRTLGAATSLRLAEADGGRLRVEIPTVETGTGSHTVVREGLARLLDRDPGDVEVVQVATELPVDAGVGGSWTTATLSVALEEAATAWRSRGPEATGPVSVEVDARGKPALTSFCAQLAQVAVDPESGQVKVLEILTALDVASVLRERAHQMQIDGGAVMGFGFACMEDLLIDDGQVWAGNLGEFRIPALADLPALRTVLVEGSRGFGALDVKPVGELSNVPTAAAIANAVADAVGVRVTRLPIRPEDLYRALRGTEEGGR